MLLSLLVPAATALALIVQPCGAAIASIPNFNVRDTEIAQLVNAMRDADTEKPTFCDVHVDYQGSFSGNNDAAPKP